MRCCWIFGSYKMIEKWCFWSGFLLSKCWCGIMPLGPFGFLILILDGQNGIRGNRKVALIASLFAKAPFHSNNWQRTDSTTRSELKRIHSTQPKVPIMVQSYLAWRGALLTLNRVPCDYRSLHLAHFNGIPSKNIFATAAIRRHWTLQIRNTQLYIATWFIQSNLCVSQ